MQIPTLALPALPTQLLDPFHLTFKLTTTSAKTLIQAQPQECDWL